MSRRNSATNSGSRQSHLGFGMYLLQRILRRERELVGMVGGQGVVHVHHLKHPLRNGDIFTRQAVELGGFVEEAIAPGLRGACVLRKGTGSSSLPLLSATARAP